MKLHLFFLVLIALSSCQSEKLISIDFSEVEKIKVYQGYPGTKIEMMDKFEEDFIDDLNDSKNVGPTKYAKTHQFQIHYISGKIDTIYTNGSLHQWKGWSRSKMNLLEKYSKDVQLNTSDTILSQLEVATSLKELMASKKYEEAIQLFSLEQQSNIKSFQNDEDIFNYWCMAWTFDSAKYDRYVSKIKEGKAPFVYENNGWKINEK